MTISQPASPAAQQPRTRRAILAGAVGGIGALAATVIGGATRTEASAGSPLIIGSSTNNAGTSNTILTSTSTGASFQLTQNGGGTALFGYSTPATGPTRGVYGRTNSANGDGVQARNAGTAGAGAGLRAFGGQNEGIVATTDGSGRRAVSARAQHGVGVDSYSQTGNAIYCQSDQATALYALGYGGTKSFAAIQGANGNPTNGMAAYLTNNSSFATAHLYNASTGQVLWMQNGGTDAAGTGGGDFIVCRNEPQTDTQFRVATDGTAFSDTSFNGGGADFAELMPAAGTVEPGDVLAVRPDGRLERSAHARQASVMGVCSTKPGFIGGASVDGSVEAGQVPLAVVGVAPVKASAENGPIHAGDRLVSASLAGHAMRADEHPEVGTVIGKALGSVNAGTGSIQMLVILQ